MIVHRALRDVERCRIKYGKAWEEYERRVPYIFIPVSFLDLMVMVWMKADWCLVCYLEMWSRFWGVWVLFVISLGSELGEG